jgi:hypothetical protein
MKFLVDFGIVLDELVAGFGGHSRYIDPEAISVICEHIFTLLWVCHTLHYAYLDGERRDGDGLFYIHAIIFHTLRFGI